MANYIVPQVLISQSISEVALNTIENQNVLVIGPNYQLFRYGDASEKPSTFIGTYNGSYVEDSSGKNVEEDLKYIPYPDQPTNSTPDESYVKLFGDDLIIQLLKVEGFTKMEDKKSAGSDVDGRLKFDFALAGKRRGEGVISTIIDPSNDVELLEYSGEQKYEVWRDFGPGDVIRLPYTDINKQTQIFQSTIKRVFSSNGGDIINAAELEDTLPTEVLDSLESGDGTYGGEFYFCAKLQEYDIPSKKVTRETYNWKTYADEYSDKYGINVFEDMQVYYGNWDPSNTYYSVVSAKLYLQYRALLRDTAKDITTVDHHTHVEAQLGTIHPDNPLAFGVYLAALNSGDRLVYYCGVDTNDLSGYNEVLGKASLTDEVYFIVPLTKDEEVIDSVKGHCKDMSTKYNKLWRIGFVCKEAPTIDMIYDASANVDNEPFYAKFSQSKVKDDHGAYNVMQFMWDETDPRANTVVRCNTEVEDGDVVRVYTGDVEDTWDETKGYTEYQVRKVLSNTVLVLSEGVYWPGIDYSKHYKVELYRKLSHLRQAKYIADESSRLATRRMYNVFPTVAVTGGVAFGGEFLAAAAAGLASSVLPQQPITNVEINGVSDIPIVYQTFTREELDTIAEGGTFIIMQDRPGSKVYVRHQISTAYRENNLLTAELSITKNLDSISYYFAKLFANLIGRYNITPELINVVRVRLENGLQALETQTYAGLYGPQVLAEGTEILSLRQSETNKDHIIAQVHLNLPVPFNYFDLDLEI